MTLVRPIVDIDPAYDACNTIAGSNAAIFICGRHGDSDYAAADIVVRKIVRPVGRDSFANRAPTVAAQITGNLVFNYLNALAAEKTDPPRVGTSSQEILGDLATGDHRVCATAQSNPGVSKTAYCEVTE